MAVNSSSSSSSDTIYDFVLVCLRLRGGRIGLGVPLLVYALLVLPLCVFVLGHRRRREASGARMSHSDFFAYNMAATDLLKISGMLLAFCGSLAGAREAAALGNFLQSVTFSGQTQFYVLTCVERHLAVVHPLAYRRLRRQRGVRIRNGAVGVVWLLCVSGACYQFFVCMGVASIVYFFFVLLALSTICYLSVSVLRVLRRPGPGVGAGGGARPRADRAKLRAFYTIVAILGVLVLKFGGNLVPVALEELRKVQDVERCAWWFSDYWFSLPGGLLLPLLVLRRAGKLRCVGNNSSGTTGRVGRPSD